MSRFVTGSHEIVNMIRDNLRDRYASGFPILKELLQNADDGGATACHVCWVDGIVAAEHPLLRGPALVVANDGVFRQHDQDGIQRIGLSHRGAEKATIGKFGLGLKSVFHLCEAFFYLASAIAVEDGSAQRFQPRERAAHATAPGDGSLPGDILNPWADLDDGPYKAWETFSPADRVHIRNLIAPVLISPQWFLVWLPMRRREHLLRDSRGREQAIVSVFPEETPELLDFAQPERLAESLPSVLPLFGHLRTITFWRPEPGRDGLVQGSTIQLDVHSGEEPLQVRRHPMIPLVADVPHPLQGAIRTELLQQQEGSAVCHFAGGEMLLGDQEFETMRASEKWPRHLVLQSEHRAEETGDKNDPHVAAYFTRQPASRGQARLRVQAAAFLPVGVPMEDVPIAGTHDYTLTLHACYFVDAGRARVQYENGLACDPHDLPDEAALMHTWNSHLQERGVLPLILRAMERLMTVAKLADPDIEALVSAIQATDFFKRNRHRICDQLQFVRRFTPDGWSWQCLATSCSIYELPWAEPLGAQVPALFSSLAVVSEKLVLLSRKRARLCLQPDPRPWPADIVLRLLENVPVAGAVASPEALSCLVQFVAECKLSPQEEIRCRSALVPLARRMFAKVPWDALDAATPELQQFLALIPQHLRWVVPHDTRPEWRRAFRGLCGLQTSILLVPRRWEPAGSEASTSQGLPNEDDGRAILGWLQAHSEDARLLLPTFALHVLRVAGAAQAQLLREFDAVPLFEAWDVERKKHLCSARLLVEAREAGNLFRESPASQDLLRLVTACLEERELLTVRPEVVDLLFGDKPVLPCDEQACVALLEHKPALGTPSARAELLQRLEGAPHQVGDRAFAALRYLLHGQPDQYDDALPLFRRGDALDPVWETVVQRALKVRGENWRAIHAELARGVRPRLLDQLDVRALDVDGICTLLNEAGPGRIRFDDLGDAQLREVFLKLKNEPELLRSVRVHRTTDRRMVAVGERTYLQFEGPYHVPPGLLEGVTVIQLHADVMVATVQRELIRTLDASGALHLALTTSSPQTNCDYILDTVFRANGQIQDQVLDLLKETSWLPLRSGSACAPHQVLHFPGLDDVVARVAANSEYVPASELEASIFAHGGVGCQLGGLIPSPFECLQRLIGLLRDKSVYHVGRLDPRKPELVDRMLVAFEEAPANLLPVRSLLAVVHGTDAFRPLLTDLVGAVVQPIGLDATVALLCYLQTRHEKARGGRSAVREVFDLYLGMAAREFHVEDWLPRVRLLNQDGLWRGASHLCVEPGVHPSSRLDKRQEGLLADYLKGLADGAGTLAQGALPTVKQAARKLPPRARSKEGHSYLITVDKRIVEEGAWWHKDTGQYFDRAAELRPLGEVQVFQVSYLPDGKEKWLEWIRLGMDAMGRIDRQQSFTVDAETAIARRQASKVDIELVRSTSGEVLNSFVQDWVERGVPPEVVATFLAVFGNVSIAERKAETYLGNRSLKDVRERLAWTRTISVGKLGDARTLEPVFRVSVARTDTRKVLSLLGELFEASLEGVFEHLLVGNPHNILIQDGSVVIDVTLREIAALQVAPSRLTQFVQKTTEEVLRRVFWPGRLGVNADVEALWTELADPSEFELESTQEILLETLLLYLKQLGPTVREGSPPLARLIQEWHQLVRDQVETSRQRGSAEAAVMRAHHEAATKGRELRERLRELIKEDRSLQRLLLEAVRAKMRQEFQYRVASIPFELFQNADDAVAEMNLLRGPGRPLNDWHREFLVAESGTGLVFGHWGRGINQFQSTVFDQGRARGFDRDLEKMLQMLGSEKGAAQADGVDVTGRFGLGFKSVFLATDRVEGVSGRLSFSIVGGVFPEKLTRQKVAELGKTVKAPDDSIGTALRLVRSAGKSPDLWNGEILEPFVVCAPLLLAFSKQLKKCTHLELDGKRVVTSWHETPVPGVAGLFRGSLSVETLDPKGARRLTPTSSLIFRMEDRRGGHTGAVFVEIGPSGIKPLEEARPEAGNALPRVWVTAPLQSALQTHFAFNGSFEVDIGRAQIAPTSQQNLALAGQLGEALGNALVGLFELMQGPGKWDEYARFLGFTDDYCPYRFWEAIWTVFSKELGRVPMTANVSPEAMKLAVELETRCLAALAPRTASLFSGLWEEPYRTLIPALQATHFVEGALSRREVFEAAEASGLLAAFRPGAVVSRSVREILRLPWPDRHKALQALNLSSLVERHVGQCHKASPRQATLVGRLITEEFLGSSIQGDASELEVVRKLLGDIRFGAKDGHWHPADKLLMLRVNSDDVTEEDELAAFAPPNRVLHESYGDEDALAFFVACRWKLKVPETDEVAGWARDAQENAQPAVARYLLHGDRRLEFAEKLHEDVERTWLQDFLASNDADRWELSPDELARVHWLLRGVTRLPSDARVSDAPPPPGSVASTTDGEDANLVRRTRDPEVVLRAMWQWWSQEGPTRVRAYECKVYPPGSRGELTRDVDCVRVRKNWLILLLLGAFATMGRQKDTQHRDFLNLCASQRWLDVFCARQVDANAWIGILERYFARPGRLQTYYQWLKHWPGFYQLSTGLEVYAESLLTADYFRERFALRSILSPDQNRHLQGTGLAHASSIEPTLGIGCVFVMRELARRKVLKGAWVRDHCYYAPRRVRLLFREGLGLELDDEEHFENSVKIHDFLCQHLGAERAHFGLGFDLPFREVACNPELQERFFSQSLMLTEGGEDS